MMVSTAGSRRNINEILYHSVATSEHITIDSELLRRLIDALPGGTTASQPLQRQLLESKAREEALCALLQQNTSESETGELSSVHSMREVSEMPDEHMEIIAIDSATRPTTPNETTEGLELPVITELEVQEQVELEAKQTRPSSAELAELNILRKHYEELRLHMAADGNELVRYNLELHEQNISLEQQLQQQSSSYGFMREEYDQLLTQQKCQELHHIEDTAAIGKQLAKHKAELAAMTEQLRVLQSTNPCTAEEREQLEQRNATLSMQLATAMQQLLGELKLPDISADYGVIGDNYQLDYVPVAEFEQQRQELATWRSQQSELQRENKQLEGLLQVANGQIQSQQKLLNEITDNHISLRHLVADLQSSSDDKLMLAKMQRDLDTGKCIPPRELQFELSFLSISLTAKAETSRLELERKRLQQTVDNLETQLQAAEQLATVAQHDFQLERGNHIIKQK